MVSCGVVGVYVVVDVVYSDVEVNIVFVGVELRKYNHISYFWF